MSAWEICMINAGGPHVDAWNVMGWGSPHLASLIAIWPASVQPSATEVEVNLIKAIRIHSNLR